jgi:hypothetical protein
MKAQKLPKSIRKFIRKEKARIRREVSDPKQQEILISQLYQRFLKEKSEKK